MTGETKVYVKEKEPDIPKEPEDIPTTEDDNDWWYQSIFSKEARDEWRGKLNEKSFSNFWVIVNFN